MKFKSLFRCGVVLFNLAAAMHSAFAQGTAFTYQGRLNDGGSPANGNYDLRFALFDQSSGGTQQGGAITNARTAISNGLFTILLDFGSQFPGPGIWLEIGTRTNGGAAFTTLAPRQLLTPTPYAVYAAAAANAGAVAATNISGIIPLAQLSASVVTNGASGVNLKGAFTGDGSGLTNLANPAAVTGTNVVIVTESIDTNFVFISGAGDPSANGRYSFWKTFIARQFYTNELTSYVVSFPFDSLGILSNAAGVSLYYFTPNITDANWSITGGTAPAPNFSSYATNYTTNSMVMLTVSNQSFAIPIKSQLVVSSADGSDVYASRTNGVPWKTIQAAMRASVPGDAVFVRPGIYKNQFTISNNVAVVGAGRNVVIAGIDDGPVGLVTMQNNSSLSNIKLLEAINVAGTNVTIYDCELGSLTNSDTLMFNYGWGNFKCWNTEMYSSYDNVNIFRAGTEDSHIQFFNCRSYVDGGVYAQPARALVTAYDAKVVWIGGSLEAHNGTPRTVCVELGGNGADGDGRGATVELSGTRLVYDTTNELPAYAIDWQDCGNCTATQYGYFVNTEDVYGGTLLSVGTVPYASMANATFNARNISSPARTPAVARVLTASGKNGSAQGAASAGNSAPAPAPATTEIVTLADAETIAVDASLGSTFQVTLHGDRTHGNPTNIRNGQSLKFFFIQDSLGGRKLTLGSSYGLGADIPRISLSTNGSRIDVMTTTYLADYGKGTNVVWGFVKGY